MSRALALWAAVTVLGACSGAPPTTAPRAVVPADTLAVQPVGPVFDDARALALDSQRHLYIADAGAATLVVLDPAGGLRTTLGGPGTGDYAFLDPSGVDPTNGLVLVVADTGNGRLQRFSRDGRLLSTVPVPVARGTRDGQPFGVRDTPGDDRRLGQGRPTAVAAAVTGELYAVEETEGVVLRWDDRRRFDRVVGGMDAGEGTLRTPVDLALGPAGRLFVADPGHAAVLVYDAFGQYLRRIGDGQCDGIVAVAVVGERLVVLLPGEVRLYGLDGRRLATWGAPASVVDASGTRDALYLLTPTHILRTDEAW